METWLNVAAVYVVVTWVLMLRRPTAAMKEAWFALSGLAVTYLCFFNDNNNMHVAAFGFTLVFIYGVYLVLMLFDEFPEGHMPLVAMLLPIAILACLKIYNVDFILGFSYLAFRAAYLAYEMHIGRVRLPNPISYTGFMLFPLTFIIGPISPYKYYYESIHTPSVHYTFPSRCLGRIFIGILKCYLYAQLFKTLSFFSYWQTYYEHNLFDFTLSGVATILYIYFNFSGACDILIGASALIGIHVQENFRNPFLSRNLAEFWTRNHITMTQVVRDVLFTPMLLALSRKTRGRHMLLVTSFCTIFAFLIVGAWHGNQLGYLLFGLMHGIGVVIVNIYGQLLRKAPAGYQRWVATSTARCVSTFITFMYVSYSSVFFGSDAKTLGMIWKMLNFF